VADDYFSTVALSDVSQYIFLVYGGSGTGKTRLAAQFPDPLFLSCDTGVMGGLLSGVQFTPKQVRLNTYQQLLALYPRLEAGANKDFKTLVLDSLTSFNQMVVRDIVAPTMRETPRFDDWNLAVARMRNVINKLASFGTHLIFTATEQIVKDELQGKTNGLPNLPGKLAQEAPAGVDIVLHLYVKSGYGTDGKKKVTYCAATTPDDTWYAKDRSGTLAPEIVLPPTGAFEVFKHLFASNPSTKGV
jgi:hypothetical protein